MDPARRKFLFGTAIVAVAVAIAAWLALRRPQASSAPPAVAVPVAAPLVPVASGTVAFTSPGVPPPPALAAAAAGATLPTADTALPGTWVDVTAHGEPGVAVSAPAPLIIGLHGRGDTAEHFSTVAGRFGGAFAWRILHAPLPFADGRQWFRDEADLAGLDAAVDQVYAHVRAQQARAGALDVKPVALFGFSQGCMLALHYAIRYPQTLRVVVCAGGGLVHPVTESGTGIRPTILFLHGTDDHVVPIAAARTAMQVVENLGFYTEIIEHSEGHTLPESEMDRVRHWLARKFH